MNWKFWKDGLAPEPEDWEGFSRKLVRQLQLARRRAARGEPGMSDEDIILSFDALVGNRGFEAILQLLTEAQLQSVEDMMEPGIDLSAMKQAAGRAEALADFKLKLLELEEEAKRKGKRESEKVRP